jgi:phosphonatase-like hydrolase
MNEAGIDISLDEVLLHGAGKEKFQAIRDILWNVCRVNDEERAKAIHNVFRSHLEKAYEDLEVRPAEGAEEVFRHLRSNGVFCVLNTGYDTKTAHVLLRKLNWDKADVVDGVITASDVPRSRPFPDMIEAAMRMTGVKDPIEVIKIGDSIIDIEEGQKAGCGLNVGITGGAQTREQLEQQGPDYVISHLKELIHIVERENRTSSYVY